MCVRVQAYLQGLTERNADWTRTMDTLVDGTHFKQRLFGAHAADQERLELEGRAAAGPNIFLYRVKQIKNITIHHLRIG